MVDRRPSSILISEAQLRTRVAEMAAQIRAEYPDNVHIIAVLKGAFMFMSDLVRHMDGSVSMDFMALSSYAKGTTRSGEVRLLKAVDTTLDGKDVLIVEDIVDTGLTLTYLQEILRARNPRTLRTACLLSKPSRRKVDVQVEFIGFTIEDQFVVGYGLDYRDRYRNLLRLWCRLAPPLQRTRAPRRACTGCRTAQGTHFTNVPPRWWLPLW